MSRGLTLGQMLADLKAGSQLSTSAVLGNQANDELTLLINQVQQTLYAEYDWPFLNTYRDLTLNAGQRFYDFPAELVEESARRAEVFYSGEWLPLIYGIERHHHNQFDSTADERSDPTLRWRVIRAPAQPTEQIEVWPIPVTSSMTMRLYGKLACSRLVADADVSVIDGNLIVARAIALKRAGQKDGKEKAAQAERLYWALRGGSSKGDSFRMGDKQPPAGRRGVTIVVSGGA